MRPLPEGMSATQLEIYRQLSATPNLQADYREEFLLKQLAEKFARTASMSNRVVDSSLLKQPKEYRGEFNAQKLKEWVTTMEIFMEAKGEPRENWVTQAGTYFRDYALTWYTQLRQKHLDDNTILTWKELTDKLTVELVPDNPATLARRKMRKLEYRGNIFAHIETFHKLSLEIPNML
ncbi:hypothetical protein WAI07_18835 [Acinetobacter baumannii]